MCPTPYDFSLHQYGNNDAKSLAQSLPESMLSNGKIKDFAEINAHFTNKVFGDNLSGSMNNKDLDNIPIVVVGVSDYNQSMKLAGLPCLSLSPNRYALATGMDSLHNLEKILSENYIPYRLGGKLLYPELNVKIWPISDNVNSIYMIVPDSIVEVYPIKERILNLQCKDPLAVTQIKAEIEKYQLDFYNSLASDQEEVFYYFDKAEIYESTTLANMINKIIFYQLLFLFLIPLVLAMFYSSLIFILMREYLMLYTITDLSQSICATLGYVAIFYIGYAVLTYLNCKKILKSICKLKGMTL